MVEKQLETQEEKETKDEMTAAIEKDDGINRAATKTNEKSNESKQEGDDQPQKTRIIAKNGMR
jgi:hypothetical protein